MRNLSKRTSRRLVRPDFNLEALNHNLRIAVFSALLFSLLAPLGLSALQSSVVVPTGGKLIYERFGNLTLKYSTDFENVSSWKSKNGLNWILNINISNLFVFENSATAWIEGLEYSRLPSGITPHSGTRCIGMMCPAGIYTGGVKRCEFNIMNLDSLVGNELYVSAWIFLPSTFGYTLTDSWGSLGDAYMTDGGTWRPYIAFLLERPYGASTDPAQRWYRFYMGYRDIDDNMHQMGDIEQFPLASYLGAWHHLEYYMYRDTGTSGILKYWLDGVLLFNISGVPTDSANYDCFTTPAKIYYSGDDSVGNNMWIDDLEIYGK